jgi:hypothetical protein
MTVTLRGERQTVRLAPTGAEITLVAIDLRRE